MQSKNIPISIQQQLVEAARRVAIRVHRGEEDPARERVLVLVAAEFAADPCRLSRVPDLPEPHAELAWSTYLETWEQLRAGEGS